MKGLGKTIARRRKENKTDYKARALMLRGNFPRVVVRKTNRFVIAQIVQSSGAQDKVIVGASSKELIGKGWPEESAGSLKSLPAAYLTGILIGKKAKEHGIKKAILDIGMQRNAAKGRLYAVLRGVVESGVDVPHNKNSMPDDKFIMKNKETSHLLNKVKEKI